MFGSRGLLAFIGLQATAFFSDVTGRSAISIFLFRPLDLLQTSSFHVVTFSHQQALPDLTLTKFSCYHSCSLNFSNYQFILLA